MGMVRLLDLQLLYGTAGAREQFEKLCNQLICSQFSMARSVRPEGGDGGVDLFVGNQSDPDGITVFQMKYFPAGLKASQKQQIRESFRQCYENVRFALKEWILCVPLDLSQDEISWFTEWSAKETSKLLPPGRIDWWGETKLGNLLLLPINARVKEAFFPQEHLRQLAEIQDTLTYLVDDLRTRPAQPDLANLVLQQRTGEALLRYQRDVYTPLYAELARIQGALASPRNGNGPFPNQIPVVRAQQATLLFTVTGESLPVFSLWPESRHDFSFFGAFSTATQQRLDDLQKRLVAYNNAVEVVRPTVQDALTRALLPALEQETQDPEYQRWVAQGRDASVPRRRWFEWVEMNLAPSNSTPGKDAANWWIRSPLDTLGWLLAGNAARAGREVHADYQRLQENNAQHKGWFQSICANALGEFWNSSEAQAFRQTQEQAFRLLAELTQSLLNVLHDIRFHHEGGIPPL